MKALGLGSMGWAAVALVSVLNLYAIVPTVSGGALVAALLGIPIGSFLWVSFLKAVAGLLFGRGGAEQPESA